MDLIKISFVSPKSLLILAMSSVGRLVSTTLCESPESRVAHLLARGLGIWSGELAVGGLGGRWEC